jgi:hypothetical protein
VGDAEEDRRLAHRYLETTAHATFLKFVLAEAAALYGVACGPSTLTVALTLDAAVFQTYDLAKGVGLRASFGPTALAGMVRHRRAS